MGTGGKGGRGVYICIYNTQKNRVIPAKASQDSEYIKWF